MKKILVVLAVLLMFAGSSFASIRFDYGRAKTGYDGIFAYYGLCVAVLSTLVVVNPDRQPEGLKTFIAVNAGVAGSIVFYKFYFGR